MAQYKVTDPQGKVHLIEGPENATPDEITKQAQTLIPAPESSPFNDFAKAAFQTAFPVTASIPPMVEQSIQDPQSALTAAKIGIPLAAGLATSGAGFLPALGMAGASGMIGKDVEMAGQTALGLPGAPQTSTDALKAAGLEGAKQVGWEALGQTPGLMLKGMGSAVRGAVTRAASSDPYEASKILEIAEKNPEVTKPGYFNDRITSFVDDVVKRLKVLKSNSQKVLQYALQKVGKKSVGSVDSVAATLDARLGELRDLKNIPTVKNAAQQITNQLGDIVKRGGSVTAQDVLDLQNHVYSLTSEMDPQSGRAFAGFQKDLDELLNSPKFKDLQLARQTVKAHHETESVIKQTLNVDPQIKPVNIYQEDRAQNLISKFLKHSERGQEGIKQAFGPLGGNLEERAQKLAAAGAGSGRFSAGGKGMPSVGIGQAGSLTRSPERAMIGLPVVRALAGLESPTMIGKYFRGLKAIEPHKMIGEALMPGLIRSALLKKQLDQNNESQ